MSARQLNWFDPPEPSAAEEGSPCLECGARTLVVPGSRWAPAKLVCVRCQTERFVPRPPGPGRQEVEPQDEKTPGSIGVDPGQRSRT